MKRRRITLADGRYLIFYTFDDEVAARTSPVEPNIPAERPEPERPVEAEGEEQRRV